MSKTTKSDGEPVPEGKPVPGSREAREADFASRYAGQSIAVVSGEGESGIMRHTVQALKDPVVGPDRSPVGQRMQGRSVMSRLQAEWTAQREANRPPKHGSPEVLAVIEVCPLVPRPCLLEGCAHHDPEHPETCGLAGEKAQRQIRRRADGSVEGRWAVRPRWLD